VGRDSRRLRLVVALLLLTSFTFLTLDSRSGHGTFGGARRIVGDIFGPIGHAVHGITAPIGRAFSAAIHSGRDRRRIQELEKQNTALGQEIASDSQIQKARDELRQLQYFESRSDTTLKWAQVISRSGVVQDFQQTLTIDAGSMDGIKNDMYVIAANAAGGLVGQVVQVNRSTSIVRLLDDKGFTVTVQSDDPSLTTPSTITGQGPGVPLRLLVPDSQYAIKVGQTFGTRYVPSQDGFLPVPAALPVGSVSKVTTQIGDNGASADVTPFFTPGALDLVGVVLTQGRHFPRVALPPTASPTPSPPTTASPSPSATPSATPSPRTTTTSPASPSAARTSSPSRPTAVRSPSPSTRRSATRSPSTAPRSSARTSPAASRSPSAGPTP
jgi:rod shape-determining protein MreC